MTNKKFLIIFSLITIAAISFFVSSCDIKSPVEGLEVRLKTISRTTTVSVKMKDAATNALITSTVNVTFQGTDKGLVISSTNVALTSANSNQGILNFSIKDDITPTTDDPVDLTLVCKVPGYITTSKNIKVTKTGTSNFTVNLVSTSNVPDGSVTNSESVGTTNSITGTSQDINVASGHEPNSNAQASVSLPAGTKLLDENGNVLTGNIETRVTYFNPLDASSVNSFPGGLSVNVQDESGSMQNGQFVTAGFVAVDMTVNGVDVEGFENGTLQLNIDIPAGLMNPITGDPVKADDVIPLWSYNEDIGEWKFEQNIIVQTGLTTGLKVQGKNLEHLTYWNLDWFINNVPNCPFKEISFTSTGCINAVWIEVSFLLYEINYPFLAQEQNVSELISENLYLFNFPNLPYTIRIYEMINGVKSNILLVELVNVQVCDEPGIYNITIPAGTTNLQRVTINVSITCDSQSDNPRVISPDGHSLYAQKVGTTEWIYLGPFTNGQLIACLEVGATYIFGMEYDGDWYVSSDYEDPFLISGPTLNYQIVDDDRICDNF